MTPEKLADAMDRFELQSDGCYSYETRAPESADLSRETERAAL